MEIGIMSDSIIYLRKLEKLINYSYRVSNICLFVKCTCQDSII